VEVPADFNWNQELETAVEAAREAGAIIKRFYDRVDAALYTKSDGSPVTDADLAADAAIRAVLRERFPGDALLTEESGDDLARLSAERCWIVDPLDGTDQFVARTGQFDVFIALIVAGRPVVGVALHPPSGLICLAAAGVGAWVEREGRREPLVFAPVERGMPVRLVTSVWYGVPDSLPALTRVNEELGGEGEPPIIRTGLNPRDWLKEHRTHDALAGLVPGVMSGGEWDLAAPDLIVNEAGGVYTDARGTLHRYNKPDPRNGGGLAIAVDSVTHQRLLTALAPHLVTT